MALQGTLETFSIPEVLRLLAGTRKTGRLSLDGDRGTGDVWLFEGRIVATRSDHEHGDRAEAVLFDLLRYGSGSFEFEGESLPDEVGQEQDVEDLLARAEELLADWRQIESVVPTLDVHVRMVDEIEGESVTVTAEHWRTLARIGGGTTGRRIAEHHGLGELDASRLVHALVEAGVVEVRLDLPAPAPADVEAPVELPADAGAEHAPDDLSSGSGTEPVVTVDHDLSTDEVASLSENLAGFVARASDGGPDLVADAPAVGAHEIIELDEPQPDQRMGFTFDAAPPDEPVEQQPEPTVEPAVEAAVEEPAPEADDFLSQLANLSPRAAAAVEAAERGAEADETATTGPADETIDHDQGGARGDDVFAEGDESDEEINRNLLLRFLSSAKS